MSIRPSPAHGGDLHAGGLYPDAHGPARAPCAATDLIHFHVGGSPVQRHHQATSPMHSAHHWLTIGCRIMLLPFVFFCSYCVYYYHVGGPYFFFGEVLAPVSHLASSLLNTARFYLHLHIILHCFAPFTPGQTTEFLGKNDSIVEI